MGNIILGQYIDGSKVKDFKLSIDDITHIMVAGQSGSGKTCLNKRIIFEVLRASKAGVWILDFKGGLDFPEAIYGEHCKLITTLTAATQLLEFMVYEHHERVKYLKLNGCTNITAFNEEYDKPLQHQFILIDEVVEVLDKTGKCKDERAEIDGMIQNITTLARLSRATGIHLILSAQKFDGPILSTQIKNNCGLRLCGKVNDTPTSIQVLGNDFATKIRDEKGMFAINNNGNYCEMQADYLPENKASWKSYGQKTLKSYGEFLKSYGENEKSYGESYGDTIKSYGEKVMAKTEEKPATLTVKRAPEKVMAKSYGESYGENSNLVSISKKVMVKSYGGKVMAKNHNGKKDRTKKTFNLDPESSCILNQYASHKKLNVSDALNEILQNLAVEGVGTYGSKSNK